MHEEIRPLGARVLVRLIGEESVAETGLVIPGSAKHKPQRGEVTAVGDDKTIKVRPGDLVLFAEYSGTRLRLGGADYLILDAGDILAVIGLAAAKAA